MRAFTIATHHPFRTALVVGLSIVEQRRLHRLLLRAGVGRVLSADTGPGALQVLAEELVDLVLTPWRPPELEGSELLRALRRRGQNRSVPVVILDEGMAQQSMVSAVKLGAAGRLRLPVDEDQLAQVLAAAALREPGAAPAAESQEAAAPPSRGVEGSESTEGAEGDEPPPECDGDSGKER